MLDIKQLTADFDQFMDEFDAKDFFAFIDSKRKEDAQIIPLDTVNLIWINLSPRRTVHVKSYEQLDWALTPGWGRLVA